MSETPVIQQWAEYYARLGWPVFPCNGKQPRTRHGFTEASTDIGAILSWWKLWPDANIGCPAGVAWWVLDVDPRSGGDDTLYQLEREHGELPETLQCKTGGGGYHYYFTLPDKPVVNHIDIGVGLDIQAKGSYVIMPPSLHPDTGARYLWEGGENPKTRPILPAPAWLEALVTTPSQRAHAPIEEGAPIPQGMRESTLVRYAGSLRRHGATPQEILICLDAINMRCNPPLPPEALKRIASSIGRYKPEPVRDIPNLSGGEEVIPDAPEKSELVDLSDMFDKSYPELHWLVRDLIPAGLTFFVGSPKSGKSYLAYSLAIAVAHDSYLGGQWLEQYHVDSPGPVVYFALEDDEADSMLRVKELAPWLGQLAPGRFLFRHGIDIPRFEEGLNTYLQEKVIDVYHPSLIILDPISYLYDSVKKQGDQFSEVKGMLLPLRWLGKENNCAIVAVDHRRKKSNDDSDIFETIYGSQAKVAVADSLWMVVRENKDMTIQTRVRKGPDQTLSLGFEFAQDGTARFLWKGTMAGHLQTGQYGDTRQKVMEALQAYGGAMSIGDIIAACDLVDSRGVRQGLNTILYRAQRSGEVQKTNRGYYVWSGGEKQK